MSPRACWRGRAPRGSTGTSSSATCAARPSPARHMTLRRRAWRTRITRPGGSFVLVGYHPFFLMSGIPTHFNSDAGEPVTIECYVHLLSDHVRAALAAGWSLREMDEGLIDDEWLARKPKWSRYRNQP